MDWTLYALFIIPMVMGHHRIRTKSIHIPTTKEVDYRLPETVIPRSYLVKLQPDLDESIFEGWVQIKGSTIQSLTNITIHCVDLDIDFSQLQLGSAETGDVAIESWVYHAEEEYWVINLVDTLLQTEEFYMGVPFTGIIRDDQRGLYKASYKDGNGNDQLLAVTQFAPTDARRVFPCFDEPRYKATFTMLIYRKGWLNSVSNAKIVQTTNLPGDVKIDMFDPTPIMSTYLVSLVVSGYQNATKEDADNVIHGVHGSPAAINDGQALYPLDWSILTLKHMAEFTEIKYSENMAKIDQVAIPDDYFWFGAMENWGCIFYRESLLMYKEGISTVYDKLRIISIIAHENGHQWTGDLVTPIWWKYIWLNEGFATYFEHLITGIIDPEFRMMEQFVINSVHYAMIADSRAITRPVTMDVGSPEDIMQIFDVIAYDKGGSLVRMLEHILTTSIFKKGINHYLRTYQWQVVSEANLCASLQLAYEEENGTQLEKLTVQEIMESWTLQEGYPLLTVTRIYESKSIQFTQKRFFLDGSTADPGTKWIIPINYATTSSLNFENTIPESFLSGAIGIQLSRATYDEWILVNKQVMGFYRVNYDEANWRLLINHLHSENYLDISSVNRAQLLDDSFYLARSGHISWDLMTEVFLYVNISQETDYIPLVTFFKIVSFLDEQLQEQPSYPDFKQLVISALSTVFEELGANPKPNDTPIDLMNRDQVLYWMCYFGADVCLTTMKKQLDNRGIIPADAQMSVYCNGLRSQNSEDNFNWLMDKLASDDTHVIEKTRIVRAMTCSSNEEHLKIVVDIILSKEKSSKMRIFNVYEVLTDLFTNSRAGLKLCMDLLINNYADLQLRLHKTELDAFVDNISEKIYDTDYLNKLVSSKVTGSTLSKAEINIKDNIKTSQNHGFVINDIFVRRLHSA